MHQPRVSPLRTRVQHMGLHLQVPPLRGTDMSDYSRIAHEYRIAARVIAESCESCERREFDFLLHDPWERTDTFVCESCAAVA